MKIKLLSADEIIKKRGLQPGGRAQMRFAKDLLAYGDKRTPKQKGNLKNHAEIQKGGTEIYYPDPYARYLWYGVVVKNEKPVIPPDPDRNPSKPGELQYQEAPTRGKFWLKRTWTEDGNVILERVAKEAGGRVK